MDRILLVRGNKDSKAFTAEAIQKFTGIFTADVSLDEASTSSEAAGLWGMRPYKIIFIDQELPSEDLNVFLGSFMKLETKPVIVSGAANCNKLKAEIPEKYMRVAPNGLSKGFIYDCVRSLLLDKDKKIDTRVLVSILKSVMNVVTQNTTLNLTPQKVEATKSKAQSRDVTAIAAFSGDGIQGSLSVATKESLVNLFAEKMLFAEPSQITEEMRTDLLSEILNQILGVIRQELAQFGYELTPTIFVVVTGKEHLYLSRSTGKYYDMPFKYEDLEFDVTFSYDIYSEFLKFMGEKSDGKKKNALDVRLVNCAIESVIETLRSTLQIEAKHMPDSPSKTGNRQAMSLHCGHGVGVRGNYTFATSWFERDARFFASKMLYMPPEEIALDMVADSCGEMLNQIAASFRFKAEQLGYPFRHAFHGDFTKETPLDYMMRNKGYYLDLEFQAEDRPFSISFGIESNFCDGLFNLWDIISAETNAS